MIRDLQLLVFDMDGTLIDSQDIIVAGMNAAFQGAGLACPDRAAILSIVGLSLAEAMAQLAPELARPQVLSLVDGYRQSFVRHRESGTGEETAPLYPGARQALERLHMRGTTQLGVATGKARRGLDHTYKTQKLGHFFATSQTSDDHPSKPHPSMLLRALRETGAEAHRSVMVGDTEFDIAMGRAAGFRTIGVSWGYHPVYRLRAAGADIILEHYDRLDDALAQVLDGAPA